MNQASAPKEVHHSHEFTVGDETKENVHEVSVDERSFGLRMIDTPEGRNSASVLVSKMYSWRGYDGKHQLKEDPNRITLTATHQGEVCGTITVGLDSEVGIMADEIFKEEIDAFRARGARVCEFTKLAFDSSVQSKEALGALFHLSVMHAFDLHGCTDLFIEVNPRHRRFYENMLGFKRLGEAKTNPRVNAPAYLLWVSLQYIKDEVQRVGGMGVAPEGERSFYPQFFSPTEEAGILQRMIDNR
ncbi:N-acetyltransferase [Rugamonas sp.]|uniref:N-acyl amino acid synthase FeeM domain-containing protein n=1 Tax=Rugamonas sp. TaxID=1926287 RepID=UPI0025E55286|nr:N-acetyltransferase [Rugamonas sp.]